MNKNCPQAPTNKKEYIFDLGKILVKDYGKKKYYKPEEIKKSHQKSKWYDFDFDCWGISIFSSQMDFINYHRETGENCDYISMKSEMLNGLNVTTASDLFNYSELFKRPDFDSDSPFIDDQKDFYNDLDLEKNVDAAQDLDTNSNSYDLGDFISDLFD